MDWALPHQYLGPLAAQEPLPSPDPTAAPHIPWWPLHASLLPTCPGQWQTEFSQFIWGKARPKINALGPMCSRNEWGCNSVEAFFEGRKEDARDTGWG